MYQHQIDKYIEKENKEKQTNKQKKKKLFKEKRTNVTVIKRNKNQFDFDSEFKVVSKLRQRFNVEKKDICNQIHKSDRMT